MDLRFFRCNKCGEVLAGKTDKQTVQCGVLIGFTIDERPLACGGILEETTEQEVMKAAYSRRDNNDD